MVKINFEIQKRTLHWTIAIVLILAGIVGVYAILPDVPNPGHAISELQGCGNNEQILKWDGSAWGCVDISSDVPGEGIDTRCDVSGTCSQVCIGANCQTSWSSEGSGFWNAQGVKTTDGIYYTDGLYNVIADESRKGVGIGYSTTGSYKLAVHGMIYADLGIKVGPNFYVCDSSRVGLLTYRVKCKDGDTTYHSYLEICMQTGGSSYGWITLIEQDLGESCSTLGYTSSGGGGCFLSGTKVLMTDGSLKNIEEIKQGEYVLSFDETEQKIVNSEVKELLIHTEEDTNNWEKKYFILTTSSGNEIRVTGNHLIYIVKEGYAKYIQVDKLQLGYIVLVSSEKEEYFEEILSIKIVEKDPKVIYNLHLNKPNNYFAEGILVHNEKAVDPTVNPDG